MRRSGPILLLLALSARWPSIASAHPDIDAAHELYEDAAFTEALDALVRAEAAPHLTVEELRDLLALRATIHFATRADDAFRNSLRTLASVAPDYRFDSDLPPPFLEAWQQARDGATPLSVRVSVVQEADVLRFHAHVDGTADTLVRGSPNLYVREHGHTWRPAHDGTIELRREDPGAVEFYAEAIGPGGVVVARHATPENPRIARLAIFDFGSAPPPEEPERDSLPWLVAAAAGIVAVALAIALVVVVTTSDDGSDSAIVHGPEL